MAVAYYLFLYWLVSRWLAMWPCCNEIVQVHSKFLWNHWHLTTQIKPEPQFLQLEKCRFAFVWVSIFRFIGRICLVWSGFDDRLRNGIVYVLVNTFMHSLLFDFTLANEPHFKIHWKLRKIYSKEWVNKVYFHRCFSILFWFFVLFLGMRSTTVYITANEQIELISELFVYFMLVNAMMDLIPPLLYSFFEYYFLDAGEESFFLFFRAWLVNCV